MQKLKIALLSGGISGEREVSLKTGEQIFNALNKNKYEIFRYDPKTDLKKFINDAIDKKFSLVFPALHGPFGEDGKLQGMLDIIGIPYLFSGCLASALAMDKEKSKIIAKSIGLNVAKDIVLTKKDKVDAKKITKELKLPIFIKPAELGSSVGMSKANTEDELKEGIKKAFEFGDKILLEQFIKGRELTVPIMGASSPQPSPSQERENLRALPVVEIIPKVSDWFDYKAKYEAGATDEICPADIPEKIKNEIQSSGLKIFNAIGCKDLARADFIWDDKADVIYFLEINTIPGMTETSLVPQSAKVAGMEFGEFLDKLISGAIDKNV
jgi:D-alanine-D-alanine ligase